MSDDPAARMQAQAAQDQAQKDQARARQQAEQHAEHAKKVEEAKRHQKTAETYDHSNRQNLPQLRASDREKEAKDNSPRAGTPQDRALQDQILRTQDQHGDRPAKPPLHGPSERSDGQKPVDAVRKGQPPDLTARDRNAGQPSHDRSHLLGGAAEKGPHATDKDTRTHAENGPRPDDDSSTQHEIIVSDRGGHDSVPVSTDAKRAGDAGGRPGRADEAYYDRSNLQGLPPLGGQRGSDAELSWAERLTGFRQPNKPQTRVDGLTDVRPSPGAGQSHEQQAPAGAETKSASSAITPDAADRRTQAGRKSADDIRNMPKAADSQKRSADAINDQQRPTLRAENAVAGKGMPDTKKASESPEDRSAASKSTNISQIEREENFKREFIKFQQGLVDAGLRAFTPDPTDFEKSIAANPEYQDILDPNSGRLLGYAHNVTVGGISYPEIVNRDGQVTLSSLLERIEHIKGLAGEANAERNMQIRSLPAGIQQTMSLAGVVPGADWMARNPELAKAAVEAVVAFIPYIGQATMVAEAVTGRNIFGDELSRNQQALLGALALVPLAKSLAADMRALKPLIAEAAQAAGLTEAQVSRTLTTLGGLQAGGKVIDAMNAAEHGAALTPAENLAAQDIGRQLESLTPSSAKANLAGDALSAAADDGYRQAMSASENRAISSVIEPPALDLPGGPPSGPIGFNPIPYGQTPDSLGRVIGARASEAAKTTAKVAQAAGQADKAGPSWINRIINAVRPLGLSPNDSADVIESATKAARYGHGPRAMLQDGTLVVTSARIGPNNFIVAITPDGSIVRGMATIAAGPDIPNGIGVTDIEWYR